MLSQLRGELTAGVAAIAEHVRNRHGRQDVQIRRLP
jgi:hypothetical protein